MGGWVDVAQEGQTLRLDSEAIVLLWIQSSPEDRLMTVRDVRVVLGGMV